MRVTATIRPVENGLLAECSEYAISCVGATAPLAIEALREAVYERVVRPQAVAPPPGAGKEPVEVVVLGPRSPKNERERDPQGPGDA